MKEILFVQGAGAGAYEADRLLAESLRRELGADYAVRYPEMPDESNSPYERWRERIAEEFASMGNRPVLVGHSVGASHLLKALTEIAVEKPVAGVFLLETPFWGGGGWRYEGYEQLELRAEASAALPAGPLFLYHARDDEIVPFDHLALYARLLPQATAREIDEGGHQLGNDLAVVAEDIRSLEP